MSDPQPQPQPQPAASSPAATKTTGRIRRLLDESWDLIVELIGRPFALLTRPKAATKGLLYLLLAIIFLGGLGAWVSMVLYKFGKMGPRVRTTPIAWVS